MNHQPWQQKNISSTEFERIFREHTPDEELVWHRDHHNRTVTVLESNGWKFQQDNMLPVELKSGDIINITANEYHRIIKGKGSLVIKIVENL